MASVMNTPSHSRFDASFGASIMRSQPPYHSAEPLSMIDSLPSINFGFDDLRDSMARFTARFDDFIERGRKRVLEERNHFRLSLAEIQESQRARKREIEDISNKSVAHHNTIVKETKEQEEMHQAINHLTAQRDEHMARRDYLKSQIADVQKAIQVRRNAQHQHQRQLDSQARHNAPELHFWETNLCLRIDRGTDQDKLVFTYTHVDERDWDRECSFELDMARGRYDIVGVEPALDEESVDEVVSSLNDNHELAPFLKAMRALFVDAVAY